MLIHTFYYSKDMLSSTWTCMSDHLGCYGGHGLDVIDRYWVSILPTCLCTGSY